MFENRVLRGFGPKRDETGEWRKFHSEELYNSYSSPNIIRQIKSRRWAGHVARIGEQGFWWGSPKVRGHSEDRSVDGRIESEWILGRLARGVWNASSSLKIGVGGGLL
jgi:hypothetical protein